MGVVYTPRLPVLLHRSACERLEDVPAPLLAAELRADKLPRLEQVRDEALGALVLGVVADEEVVGLQQLGTPRADTRAQALRVDDVDGRDRAALREERLEARRDRALDDEARRGDHRVREGAVRRAVSGARGGGGLPSVGDGGARRVGDVG